MTVTKEINCYACEDNPKAPNISCAICGSAALSAQPAVAVPDGWKLVPTKMNAAMINAWSGGLTVSSDENAYRTSFQDAWKRVLAAAPIDGWHPQVDYREPFAAAPQPSPQMIPVEISRELMGKIIDEVFDGALEDASVIEDIYRVIVREHHALTTPPAGQQENERLKRRLDISEALFSEKRRMFSALASDCKRYYDRATAAEARVKALEEALEPFADAVEKATSAAASFGLSHWQEVPDGKPCGPLGIEWGDLRRARAALKGGEGND